MSAGVARLQVWLPASLAALLAAIPLTTWIVSTGNPVAYFSYQVPDGQLLYLAAKLAGLAAVVLMSIQLALGISGLVLRPISGRRMFRVHRGLGLATFITVLLHASLFASAASLRNKTVMASYFWPDFSHGYYRSMIALGAIALICLAMGIAAGLLRGKFPRLGKWLHRVTLPAYLLVWIHSLAIGSESRMGLMPYVYGFLAMLVAAALAYRGSTVRRKVQPRP